MTRGNDLAVAILAGGEGSRIGGGKPDLRLAGRTLLDRSVDQARRWSDKMVMAVRSASQVEGPGISFLVDAEGIEGPFAGLAVSLEWARREGASSLLTIPCDMPFLPADLASRLASAIGDHGAAIAASGGQLYPVCGLWRTRAVDDIAAYLESGRRSLHGFAAQLGFVEVDWPATTPDPFFNINTNADLVEAERLLGG